MVLCGLGWGSLLTGSSGTQEHEGVTVRTHASGKTSEVMVGNKTLGGGIQLRGWRTDVMTQ